MRARLVRGASEPDAVRAARAGLKNRRSRLLATLALFVGVAASAAAQPPAQLPTGLEAPAPEAARKPPTGVIKGRVTAADTGAGLARGRVAAAAEGATGVRKVTTTDAAGRWEITGLPADRYVITVTRIPYMPAQYGQRLPVGVFVSLSGLPVPGNQSQTVGRPVELSDGQTVDQLDVKLQRGAVISGRVTDDLGEPVALKSVYAMRLQYFEGRRQMARTGFRQLTNDLGEYRLAGLPAGTYYLMTDSIAWRSALPEDEGPSFAATFYPTGTTADAAQPITVRAGQERPAADIRLTGTRLARVSGTVVDDEGAPLNGGTVTLYEDTRGVLGVGVRGLNSATIQSGGFTLPNVAPGNYFLQAIRTSPASGVGGRQGLLPVAVSGQNVDGLSITVTQGATITGQVEFEGGAAPEVSSSTRVRAEEPFSLPFSSAGVPKIAPDWSFELTEVTPGRRVIRIAGLPDGWALKAVYADGEEITDIPQALDGRRPLSGVRILVSRRVSSVSGIVADEQAKPARDYSVLLFSTGSEKLGPGSRWRTTARPDQRGRFTVTGLPPGDYFAVAVDALMPGEGEDPEFLADLRDDAVRFTLAEGGQQSLSLKLTRLER
jgi:protocatechuate 3,4-dioxygenase beta subunit